MQQALDFREESRELVAFLSGLDANRFDEATQFNSWSTHHVLRHLHYWNWMALLQIENETKLTNNLTGLATTRMGMRDVERAFEPDSNGTDLIGTYAELVERTADAFSKTDPKARLKWAGPDMSARSSMTARLMETWSHGQELYDHFGSKRVATDRLKNIVVLGVNTFGWTFLNRKLDVPDAMPFLSLAAPSGDIWEFGEENAAERVDGSAEEFCQVVTQTRNIDDTDLTVTGPVAKTWMQFAQCFAGRAVDPPAAGTRFMRT